jgi:hypothetical protein
MSILHIITKYLDIAGPLLGVVLCLYRGYGQRKTGGFYVVLSFLLLQFIANSIAKYMSMHQMNNIMVYQANAFFSLLLVTRWFWGLFKSELSPQQLSWFRLYAIISLCLSAVFISTESTDALNSMSLSFTALDASLYCTIFYILTLLNVTEKDLLKSGSFWVSSAFFLYYCSCFIIYVTFKFFTERSTGGGNFMILWNIHNTILFVSCIIMGSFSKLSIQRN